MSSEIRGSRSQAASLADIPGRLKHNRLYLKLLVRGFSAVSYTHLTLPTSDLV